MAALLKEHEAFEVMKLTGWEVLHLQQQLLQ